MPVTTSCSARVPQRMTAAGVNGERPCCVSFATISGSWPTPMKKTSVPIPVAILSQAMPVSSLAGSSWPVTKATVEVKSRCVRGIPA